MTSPVIFFISLELSDGLILSVIMLIFQYPFKILSVLLYVTI